MADADDILTDIQNLDAGLRRAGVTDADFCALAGINLSTWWRWRSGAAEPRWSLWRKAKAAGEALIKAAGGGAK